MRFDAKLTEGNDGWDDVAGELDLPADLTELGEQLHADALHLAQLYPAVGGLESVRNRSLKDRGVEGRKKGRWTKSLVCGSGVSLAALLCVTAGMAISWLTPKTQSHQASQDHEKAVEFVNDSSEPSNPNGLLVTTPWRNDDDFEQPEELNGSASYVVPPMTPTTPVSAPGASIRNASGPQAEAYLDYIEMTSVRHVKISF